MEYYDLFECRIGEGVSLIRVSLVGEKKYELFRSINTKYYINLKHRPLCVIEYWFSYDRPNNKRPYEIDPVSITSVYRANEPFSVSQLELLEYLEKMNVGVKTTLLVTLGVLTAAAVVGVTIVVAGPAIAAWVATATNTVTIAAVSAATTVLYQVGEKIEYVRAAPMIPRYILG